MVYETLRIRILNNAFVLGEVLDAIDTFYASGKITQEQHIELTALAREHADPIVETGVNEKILELAGQIHELEQRVSALEKGSGEYGPESGAEPYVDGKWYYNGDRITWNGKMYLCVAPEGVVCVWSPDAYPAYWQELLG